MKSLQPPFKKARQLPSNQPLMKFLLSVILCALGGLSHAAPVKLIFDTDMGNDVDDLMALCMIHNLQKRGACELLAVTVTKDHPQAAAFVDAVNTLYGYPDTPIGVVRNGAAKEAGKFNLLADKHPHDLKSGADAPEAGGLIKDILAKQPDGSVVIAQVGFFTNLARLMDDAEAKELIAKKVKVLSIMAGAFQTVNFDTRHLEYNVKLDVPAAQKLAKEWPTPMVWSGFEIGVAAADVWPAIRAVWASALTPLVVDAVSVPVIAAGGIFDGRGVAAAMMLGASGAQIGSAFLRTPESSALALHKQALAETADNSTKLTRLFSGRPARSIRNRLVRELAEHEGDAAPFPTQRAVIAPLTKAAAAKGSADFMQLWSGQAGLRAEAAPSAQIFRRICDEALALLR